MTAAAPVVHDTGGRESLLSPEAVRTRCAEILDAGLDDRLPWFRVELGRMEDVTARVIAETRRRYPDLRVPFHSRWRHFELDGADLWAETADRAGLTGEARCIAAGDLAVVSVLLDAGAGPGWTFTDDATGIRRGRSEGLALASLRLFESGRLSAATSDPLRVDAERLMALTADDLAHAMQADPSNPLIGVEARAGLLRRLGRAISERAGTFARDGAIRPGNLLAALAARPGLRARDILVALLENLTDIWPSPVMLSGEGLGDTGRHPALVRADATDGIVPFHKLSQWLSYSLIEPLQAAGAKVAHLDDLTGLAEYRNGGLFVDTGVLQLRDPAVAARPHDPASEPIVEWRALTVALLDRTAETVRAGLGLDTEALPLASVLQGGTWSAGRRIAREKRADGAPPIALNSNGTVF